MARRRRSVKARNGAEPVPVQIMMRLALASFGKRKVAPNGPVTGPWLNEGLRSITKFTADGLLPPTTITRDDHQGGGMGRIARWDGARFVPITDWFSANQDVVWEEIRKNSDEFKKTGK